MVVNYSSIILPSGENMPGFERFVLQGSPFVRLAGLSGASAVALGAYGAHCKYLLTLNDKYIYRSIFLAGKTKKTLQQNTNYIQMFKSVYVRKKWQTVESPK